MTSSSFRHVFPANGSVFREGDAGDCAYIVERGRVEIRGDVDGKSVVLATRGAGEMFGEMALIDRKPRTASAVAIEECELLVVSHEQLTAYLDQADPIMKMLLGVILERFRSTLKALREGSFANGDLASAETADSERELARQHGNAVERIKLVQELEEALEKDQFELHYQPLISMSSPEVYGFESLIRWRHPERGLVSPALFIPAAEQSGLIVPIGRWTFRQACRAMSGFREAVDGADSFSGKLAIGVNISGREFSEPGFLNGVSDGIDEFGIDPGYVTLEITESLLMDKPEVAAIALDKCKDLGVRVAIDDFGTGYSSLSYLHRFPIDILKIDQSFVGSMLHDDGSREIVNSIVSLARGLRMRIVAEGIEEQDQHTALRDLGCNYAQGYLHSRPLPGEQATAFLQEWYGAARGA